MWRNFERPDSSNNYDNHRSYSGQSNQRPVTSSSSRPYSRGTDASPTDVTRENDRDNEEKGDDNAFSSNDDSLKAVINDSTFPLDDNLFLSIISSLMHCNPRECIVLPHFRLEEILSLATRAQTQLLSEWKLTEPFVALTVLCLYTTLSSNIPLPFLLKWMLLLQHLVCESLVLVQNASSSVLLANKQGKY